VERLYVDNFRGFKNQFIEVKDVNFLVGENSSGKSSVLLAFNTLFNPNFWFNCDFGAGETQVYSFEDLVSVEAKDKTYFRLGYFYDDTSSTSFLFEFSNFNGKPVIVKFAIYMPKTTIYFLINEKHLNYIEKKNENIDIEVFNSISKKSNLKEYNIEILPSVFPPVQLVSLYDIITNKKHSDRIRLPIRNLSFIAPIRSKPKKTYDEPGTPESSEGDHIPYMIRRFLMGKANAKSSVEQKINSFGLESGLFREIKIKEYDDSDDAPFRMNFVLNEEPINIVNIGYGVSQVLPIIFDLFASNIKIFAVQQPEVHLHPRAQAALGNIFYDLSKGKFAKKLIVETHSDYIIDRFRQVLRKANEKVSAQVIFFLREKGFNKAFSINIDESGNYNKDQPGEFRDFFIKEEMENLGL
jgi:AAA15 family ATPase/GTPase